MFQATLPVTKRKTEKFSGYPFITNVYRWTDGGTLSTSRRSVYLDCNQKTNIYRQNRTYSLFSLWSYKDIRETCIKYNTNGYGYDKFLHILYFLPWKNDIPGGVGCCKLIFHITVVGNNTHLINWLNVCDKMYAKDS